MILRGLCLHKKRITQNIWLFLSPWIFSRIARTPISDQHQLQYTISAWESRWSFSIPAHHPSQNSCNVGFYSQNSFRTHRILICTGTLSISIYLSSCGGLFNFFDKKTSVLITVRCPSQEGVTVANAKTSLGTNIPVWRSSDGFHWSRDPLPRLLVLLHLALYLFPSFSLFLFLCPSLCISPTHFLKTYRSSLFIVVNSETDK